MNKEESNKKGFFEQLKLLINFRYKKQFLTFFEQLLKHLFEELR